jgi:hypothetical protein
MAFPIVLLVVLWIVLVVALVLVLVLDRSVRHARSKLRR